MEASIFVLQIGSASCRSHAATKWYINIDIPEVNAFRARYVLLSFVLLSSIDACLLESFLICSPLFSIAYKEEALRFNFYQGVLMLQLVAVTRKMLIGRLCPNSCP